MKIFYHNDMDGIVSARIIIKEMRKRKKQLDSNDVIEMDYTKIFPLSLIMPMEEVYIVDYSIEPNMMEELLKITNRVIWIDHHISAIEKYKNSQLANREIAGLRANGIAGCVLTWWYFYGRQFETEEFYKDYPKNAKSLYRKEIPEYIKLAGDWDVWEHLYGQKTKAYSICFSTKIKSPFDDLYFDKIENEEELNRFCEDGAAMIDYRKNWAETFMKRYGFETEIDGFRAFVANLGNANSEFFGELINSYDIIGTFCYNGKQWIVSLYSNKDYVDCSTICSKRGGGGHKGAAGFVTNELYFKKEKREC